MSGFIKGEASSQATLFPEALDGYTTEDNSARVVDGFAEGLGLLPVFQ